MPLNDEHFVIDEDSHNDYDPAGFAKANVGAVHGKNLLWVKVAAIVVLVAAGYWFSARALSGADFALEGGVLRVPSQGWEVALPQGWKAERGADKKEIMTYPGTFPDARTAVRGGSWVRFTADGDGSAQSAFKDTYTKTQGRNAVFTDVTTSAGKAVRGDEPLAGKVSVFVDGDPAILVTAPTPSADLDAIVAGLKRGGKG